MKKMFILVYCLSMVGCVTPNYNFPKGENTADLTVISNTRESWNQRVRIFKDYNCENYPGELVGLLYSKRVGIKSKESLSTTIEAGKPLTISVYAGVPRNDSFFEMFFKGIEKTASENRNCEAFITFKPEVGAKYKAAYKIDGSPCSITLMKIIGNKIVNVSDAKPNTSCSAKAKENLGKYILTN